MTIATSGVRAAMLAAVVTLAGVAGAAAWAQTASEPVVKVPANALSVSEIESRLSAQGYKVKEIEIQDLLAEVEAYDSQGREVDLVIDRRNGETLSHKYDDDHKRKSK